MNPLNSIWGTIISGFIVAFVIAALIMGVQLNLWSLAVWLHVFAGIIWIGLLYYFNFVQVPSPSTNTLRRAPCSGSAGAPWQPG
jgi:predicted membrane protein